MLGLTNIDAAIGAFAGPIQRRLRRSSLRRDSK
jgi:hypothetical protein